MKFAYYTVVALVLLLAGPVLLCFKKCRAGLGQKFGFIPSSIGSRAQQSADGDSKRVWFHAVSVGEFNAVFPLILEFRKKHPGAEIFISTTTGTGQEQALRKAGEFATVFYFPFDLPFALNSWLNVVQPHLVAIVETEIWPGFMWACASRRIPVVLLNGRLSPKSFQGYMRWKWFFSSVVNSFAGMAVQSDSEATRYAALCGRADKIEVCGNIKIDGIKAIPDSDRLALVKTLGLQSSDFVLVAGSTHEGEETPLLDLAKECRARGCPIKLILVPRHPERFARVASLIESAGFRTRKFSRNESFQTEQDVYLLDTVGQLARFYSVANVAFVGGTIVSIGGHNLAEPCAYQYPVVCGPHVHKTRDIAASMKDAGALLVAQDVSHLHEVLLELRTSPEKCKKVGQSGRAWLHANEGALARTLRFLESHISYPNSAPEGGASGRQLQSASVGGATRRE